MLRVLNAECDQLMVMARMNVGALRCHVHLRRRRTGFSTMVGEQPWSNHPLVDLLDRTHQFIGRKGANDSSRSFAECLRGFGLGCIASQANVRCRNRLEAESHHPSVQTNVSIILHRFPEIRSLACAASAPDTRAGALRKPPPIWT